MDRKDNYEINLSKDLLTAYLSIFPPFNERNLTSQQIKSALMKKGIIYGIDDVKITIVLAEEKEVINFPIAHGKKPISGKDAEIKFHFSEKGVAIKPKELKNGKVDFYNINLVQNVKKGQLLLEKLPATQGIPGIMVTGREIPGIPGKDIILPIGKNVYTSEDNMKGYAACDGHVVMTDGLVSVLTVFEVAHDVDFSTGNIDYEGNVIIRGNIKDGFCVKAKGDVEVHGTVEGGHVFTNGNIIIKNGIRGLNKSKISAKGNILSTFIEHANIMAGKDVIVNEGIMHSTVNCGLTIQVGGRKGLVVGGTCRAGKALICKNIGSHLATLTNIEVGINPELRLNYKKVCEEQVNTKENLDKTVKALKILNELKLKTKQLPPEKERLAARLRITKNNLTRKQEELFSERQKLEEQIKNLEEGYVEVAETINCGVNISIGKANKHFTREYYKVVLKQNGMDISIEPLVV